MKTKLWINIVALASLLALVIIPSPVSSQETASLPQQPAALAGTQAPTIPPTISTVWPVGMRLGTTQTFTVEGRNLANAKAVLFDTPGLRARVISVTNLPEKAQKIRINVDLRAEVPQGRKQEAKIAVTASQSVQPGLHWFRVQTPLGTSGLARLDIGALPEIRVHESGSRVNQSVRLPATIVGTIARPGDTNSFQFDGRPGENVVFRVVASQLGSKLRSVLTLRNAAGRDLAQAGKFSGEPDAVLTYKFQASGRYAITVSDQEEQGDPSHFYRLYAGDLPYVTSVFPLGVRAGHSTTVRVSGLNLDGIQQVRVNPPERVDGWTTIPMRVRTDHGESLNTVSLAVTNEPEITEREPNDTPAEAQPIPVPAVINGHIDKHAGSTRPDEDYFQFSAHKGARFTIEVDAARLGSPLDSVIEVLDSQGRPVPQAIVRCLNETSLELSDRDSRTQGYRLASHMGFHEGDYLMVGEELNQIQYIPDQPDADIQMKGFGGLRTALLGTSPAAHYVTEPVYRAEILPPGAKFPPNGLPVFKINYRNDDGGPGYGADSRLDFVAPADGHYLVHIKDVRGLEGPDDAYQLIVRDSTPDFTLTASPENPNIPRGGRLPVEVTANRLQGYQGPIQIKVLGLPSGITASPATIPAHQESATVILEALRSMPVWLPARPFRIEGQAWVSGRKLIRTADSEAPLRVATIMPPPDLLVAAQPQEIVLKPGQTTQVTLHVTRENGFKGRVPCQLMNLPPGVKVVSAGLNGILVHSSETTHTFALKAESWAQPVSQPIYVVGQVESNSSTSHASAPVILKVEGRQEVASATASPVSQPSTARH